MNDADLPSLYTIGHSTRTWDEFLTLLRGWSLEVLADVRTVPRSRRHPHFNRERLEAELPPAGIEYIWLKELGGWRRPSADSTNQGWRLASFRGYADYMQTAEFEAALAELIAMAHTRRTAIMCAEAVPWRCHRSLIADALSVRGVAVRHITSGSRAAEHRLTAFARVEGTRITYPGGGQGEASA